MGRFTRVVAVLTGVAVAAGVVVAPGSPLAAQPAFSDVKAGAYYAEAVDWAVANGVTTGVGGGRFDPSRVTNRAQAFTFLWRLNNAPAPVRAGADQFGDVDPGAYFADAAQWAFEQGITYGIAGTAEAPTTTFGADRPMTRAQFVSILWRLRGEPVVTTPAGFTGINPGAFFADAANWAANRGIAAGDSIAFNGANSLNRAQAVTFLKRFADDSPTDVAGVDYSAPGPYQVGLREFTVNGGTLLQVYYPVDADDTVGRTPVTGISSADALGPPGSPLRNLLPTVAPGLIQDLPVRYYTGAPLSSQGPFGVYLSSHGFSGDPRYVASHLSHLASWGFVVPAPSHPKRSLAAIGNGFLSGGLPPLPGSGDNDPSDLDDIEAAITLLNERNGQPADGFFGGIDTSLLAIEGHSAGGGTIGGLVARGVPLDAIIGWATVPFTKAAAPDIPTLIVPGERDGVVAPSATIGSYQAMSGPKQLVVIANAGHNPVLDICLPVRRQGGLNLSGALAFLSALGEDGCIDGYLFPGLSTALIRHLAVAQTRWAFGFDGDRQSLSEDFLRQQFRAATGLVEYVPGT
jgi:predicted dienelactone hydrolase